jgi:hypothetical protein
MGFVRAWFPCFLAVCYALSTGVTSGDVTLVWESAKMFPSTMSENAPRRAFESEGALCRNPPSASRTERIEQFKRQQSKRGFASSAALIRHAVQQELDGCEDGAEQRIAATLDQIRGELSRIHRVQQTLFAFVDALAKAVLMGLPEQSPSGSRGKERYDRFVKSAAAAMLNNPQSSGSDGSQS